MKRFTFSLERVLQFRRTQADIEKARLVAAEAELQVARGELEALSEAFREEVRQVEATPEARAELGRYRMVVETQTIRLNQRIGEKQAKVERQRAVYVKANQAAEVLDKVKIKQRKTWELHLQKELDALAMDSYLARWKN